MWGSANSTLLLSLGWGLIVLLSFACLGRTIARVLAPGARRDLALETGWGMAGMVALGGWLNLLGLATAQSLRGLVCWSSSWASSRKSCSVPEGAARTAAIRTR